MITISVYIIMKGKGYCNNTSHKRFKVEYDGLKLTLEDLLGLIKKHNIECGGTLCYYESDNSYVLDIVINENYLDSVNYGLYRINEEIFYEYIYNMIKEGFKSSLC